MFIAFYDANNAFLFVAAVAPGLDAGEAAVATAQSFALTEYTWREITAEEAEELQRPPAPTPEEIIADYTDRVQKRLDDFARSENRFYDNMLSLCTYATSANAVYSVEGQYGVAARDATWAAAFAVMNAVLAGQRPVPTWEELEAELPLLVWPSGVWPSGGPTAPLPE